MKKIIGIALAVLMLLTMIVPAFAYETGSGSYRVAKHNQYEVLYTDDAPTIDGAITEEEWGTPVIVIKAADAIKAAESLVPSDYALIRNVQKTEYEYVDDIYTVYMRWDENYLYIGIIMEDMDGDEEGLYSDSDAAAGQAWKNDTQQIKIEPGEANQGSCSYDPFITDQDDIWGGCGSVWFAYTRIWEQVGKTKMGKPIYALTDIQGNLYNSEEDDKAVYSGTDFGNEVMIDYDADALDEGKNVYYYEYKLSKNFLNMHADPSRVGTLEEGAKWAIAIGFVNNNTIVSSDHYQQWLDWGVGGIPVAATDPGFLANTANGNIGLTLVKSLSGEPVEEECKHEHTHLEGGLDANCVEDGLEPDVVCDDCGEVVTYGKLIDHKTIPHVFGEDDICHTLLHDGVTECGKVQCHHENVDVEDAEESTCSKHGYSGDVYCDDCGILVEEGHELDLVDHVYGANGKCKWCGADAPSISSGNVTVKGNIPAGATVKQEKLPETNALYDLAKSKIEHVKSLAIYDISLLDAANVEVQPNGVVIVTLEIPEELLNAAGEYYNVYHHFIDGDIEDFEELAVTVDGNKIQFTTNGFSAFVLAKESTQEDDPVVTPTEPDPTKPAETDPSKDTPTKPDDKKEETKSNTGLIIGIIAAVVVVAVVVVVIIVKKKK